MRDVVGADVWGLGPLARARRAALPDGLTLDDSFAAEIEVWRFRLRIERVRLACIRFQEREMPVPFIRRPMELAGLKSRLQRAELTEKSIEETGKRFDRVLNEIDDLHASAKAHAGDLEMYKGDLANTINRMIGGSNGGDPLDKSDGQDSAGAKVPAADPVKPPAAAPDITEIAVADVAPVPESAEELTRRVG